MKGSAFLVLLFGLIIAAPASAQFYKYQDEQGQIRFTDDINQVPATQRRHVRSYAATLPDATEASAPTGVAESEKTGDDAARPVAAEAAGVASVEEEPLDSARARLEEMKKQIDSDYRTLAVEKESLSKAKEVPKNWDQAADYNQRVKAFNQKAADYEKRSKDLRKQVEAYNARVSEKNARLAQSVKK
jgi:hypothetical protein